MYVTPTSSVPYLERRANPHSHWRRAHGELSTLNAGIYQIGQDSVACQSFLQSVHHAARISKQWLYTPRLAAWYDLTAAAINSSCSVMMAEVSGD
jgi:hypothetical protein